jgi:hypothetical protein
VSTVLVPVLTRRRPPQHRGEEAETVGGRTGERLDGVLGCGIRPTTLPRALAMPAMSRYEPFGFAGRWSSLPR